MRIDRAAKFGLVGTIGVTAISLLVIWLFVTVQADVVAGNPPPLGSYLIIWIVGTALTLTFLFAVAGVFVDRKLEARGIASTEE